MRKNGTPLYPKAPSRVKAKLYHIGDFGGGGGGWGLDYTIECCDVMYILHA